MAVKHYFKKNFRGLDFGLDIGMASVGWSVSAEGAAGEERRLLGLGSRAFDKAEQPKTGESLNLPRRQARLLRRRLRRRRVRLDALEREMVTRGMIAPNSLFQPTQAGGTPFPQPWLLRVQGLERKLSADEWARVLYHAVKHRGFHFANSAENNGDDSEGGKVKQALSATAEKLGQYGGSVARMIVTEFPDAQRNQDGDYSKAIERKFIADEVQRLFSSQQRLGNPHTADDFREFVLGNGDRKTGLLWQQRPPLQGEALLRMLGKCAIERSEYCAPRNSFSAERHAWLTRLTNLKISENFTNPRPLNAAEIKLCLHLPYSGSGKITYAQLRKRMGWDSEIQFTNIVKPKKRSAEETSSELEKQTLIELKGWGGIKKLLEDEFEHELKSLLGKAQNGETVTIDGKSYLLLDYIAWVCSVYKDDEEVKRELSKATSHLGDSLIEKLTKNLRYREFGNLSFTVLNQIIPHMEQGHRYDDAIKLANPNWHHSDLRDPSKKQAYLPPFYLGHGAGGGRTHSMKFNPELEEIRNPVVLRALNQARKVVNELIRTYGRPSRIHIELARDLNNSFEKRKEIKLEQEKYRKNKELAREEFVKEYPWANAKDHFKYELYKEQDCKCAYSLQPIDLRRIAEPGYVEVDHIIPYARCFNDGKNNKVLVLTAENRNKKNCTPYEFFGHDEARWQRFSQWVEGNPKLRGGKKKNLLRKEFSPDDEQKFMDRNLNDTRYISRYFKNFVETWLELVDDPNRPDAPKAERCIVLSGEMTSKLRHLWGLEKNREESDRHHALDAAVIAACDHAMVQKLSNHYKKQENRYTDALTAKQREQFALPWPQFRDEVMARLTIDDRALLQQTLIDTCGYSPELAATVKPLLVSRAPQRRNGGALHKETIYGLVEKQSEPDAKASGKSMATERIWIHKLKSVEDFSKLRDENSKDQLVDLDRNRKLYDQIEHWLESRPEREKSATNIEATAKAEDRKLTEAEIERIKSLRAFPRNRDKNGQPTGPQIKQVTTVGVQSGIPIRGGIAANGEICRIDIFSKGGKFFIVPLYTKHLSIERVEDLPNRAIVGNKVEEDWLVMDESYRYHLSLYPNDLVEVKVKDRNIFGYYSGADRSTAAISIWAHDRNKKIGKDGLVRGIGIQSALSITKFNVDILGNFAPAPMPEERQILGIHVPEEAEDEYEDEGDGA
ncbi:MAG: type II CRISPR RNA-guided endonuclease Cas9 [Alphaproteobacteria bacterium]|nr:type II CRISPR RNA-guided endonuclease Cas9 [Alphaproteobacteria bacterium]